VPRVLSLTRMNLLYVRQKIKTKTFGHVLTISLQYVMIEMVFSLYCDCSEAPLSIVAGAPSICLPHPALPHIVMHSSTFNTNVLLIHGLR
jgi:hypothetical protein